MALFRDVIAAGGGWTGLGGGMDCGSTQRVCVPTFFIFFLGWVLAVLSVCVLLHPLPCCWKFFGGLTGVSWSTWKKKKKIAFFCFVGVLYLAVSFSVALSLCDSVW